jgi:hypothetical protein
MDPNRTTQNSKAHLLLPGMSVLLMHLPHFRIVRGRISEQFQEVDDMNANSLRQKVEHESVSPRDVADRDPAK